MAKVNKNLFGGMAVKLQELIEDEAEAVKGYQEALNEIQNIAQCEYMFKIYDNAANKEVDSPTANADRKACKLIIETYKHYIAEEIRHLKGLQALYEAVTGIKSDNK